MHFVSPSIWAWRGERVHKIGRAADLVLCLFPFEPALLRQRTASPRPTSAIRWPTRSRSSRRATASRAALGLGEDETVVALLPGSRRSEIEYIAPRLLGAAAVMHRARPGAALRRCRWCRGCATLSSRCAARTRPTCRSTLLDGHSHEALAACDVALVASGTATLEAALFKRPMVIAYAMHACRWQMDASARSC